MSDKNDPNIPKDKRKGILSQAKNRRDQATLRVTPESFYGKTPIRHRAYLKITDISNEENIIELRKKETVIGRTPECDIPLNNNNVSRKHACVGFRNEEYYIRDLDSTNGVYVNGIRIVKCVLRNLDQIDIGGTILLFNEEQTLEQT